MIFLWVCNERVSGWIGNYVTCRRIPNHWKVPNSPFFIRTLFLIIITTMEPFLGQICLFGFDYAPTGWALCNGQMMSIAQNNALFALLGTTYGGNGQTTFALPDLRGRVAINQGGGPGLSPHTIGEVSGTENVTLIQTQMPAHNHMLAVSGSAATTNNPNGGVLAASAGNDGDGNPVTVNTYNATPNATANPQAISMAGGNQPHENMQPYLTLNYCIALTGVFPSRS